MHQKARPFLGQRPPASGVTDYRTELEFPALQQFSAGGLCEVSNAGNNNSTPSPPSATHHRSERRGWLFGLLRTRAQIDDHNRRTEG